MQCRYMLAVNTLSGSERLFFDTFEEAKVQLDRINDELNKDKYARNEKKENTITLECPNGPVVVVLEQVHTVRIIDQIQHQTHSAEISRWLNDHVTEEELRRKRRFLELEKQFE